MGRKKKTDDPLNDEYKKPPTPQQRRKRREAFERVVLNMSENTFYEDTMGRELATRIIHTVESYPNQYYRPEDQFISAIDNIDLTDFKTALIPVEKFDNSNFLDNNEEYYDFSATLSLNGGDVKAYHILLDNLKKYKQMKFRPATKEEKQEDKKRKQEANEASESTARLTQAEAITLGAKSSRENKKKTSQAKLDLAEALSREYTPFIIMNYASLNDAGSGVRFIYDYYDGGEISGHDGIPSISIAMELDTIHDDYGTVTNIEWSYIITFHTATEAKPKDSELKRVYNGMKVLAREASASIGIAPIEILEVENEEDPRIARRKRTAKEVRKGIIS